MAVRIHLVGGLGSFGRNCMVVQDLESLDAVVVDAGAGFPQEPGAGRELAIPDPAFLAPYAGRLKGYLLTHGHEDHIGAVGYLHRAWPAPVYSGPTTLALVEHRCVDRELPVPELRPLLPGQDVQLGSFHVTALAVSHSIPDSLCLVLEAGGVRLVHSGDFRVDAKPLIGPPTDLEGLRLFGELGVDLLMADSTGALTPGHNPGEASVRAGLARVMEAARGRVFLTTFASHVQRVALAAQVSEAAGRKLLLAGRGMLLHARIARTLGQAPWPEGIMVHPSAALEMRPEQLTVILSGCQGEERSAFWRLATLDSGLPEVDAGDAVVHSARTIPGCEVAVTGLLDSLARRGASIFDAAHGVHVSGHGYQEDLRELVQAVAPRAVLPLHGGHRHMHGLAALAREQGLAAEATPVLESGDFLEVAPHAPPWPCGRRCVPTMLVDDDGNLTPQDTLSLQRRELLSGVVVVSASIDGTTGDVQGKLALSAQGLGAAARRLLDGHGAAEARAALSALSEDERCMPECVETAVSRALRRMLRRVPGGPPSVVVHALVR